MIKQIALNLIILAADIQSIEYTAIACPINLSLERAGYPNLKDTGFTIINTKDFCNLHISALATKVDQKEYEKLVNRLLQMTIDNQKANAEDIIVKLKFNLLDN